MGSGDYEGRDLVSQEADISIAGSGNVTVTHPNSWILPSQEAEPCAILEIL
jgi:hypothetical protein